MANPQHEPTMEEILASIRKIISEDTPTPATPPADSQAGEAEVLDLTQEVQEGHSHLQAPQTEAVDSVERASAEPAAPARSAEGIFSEKTRNVLSEAVAGLEPPANSTAEKPALPTDPSIEAVFERAVREAFDPVLKNWLAENTDTVVERMKPAIRDWLDEHFPAMLEDAVRCELGRAVKARSRH